jgi:hypothetical protein
MGGLRIVAVLLYGHVVLDPLILSDQPRTGDWLVVAADAPDGDVAAVQLVAQRFQPVDCRPLQTAMRQLLNSVS